MNAQKCESCRFWVETPDDAGRVSCHRDSYTVMMARMIRGNPIAGTQLPKASNWCGQWEPRLA